MSTVEGGGLWVFGRGVLLGQGQKSHLRRRRVWVGGAGSGSKRAEGVTVGFARVLGSWTCHDVSLWWCRRSGGGGCGIEGESMLEENGRLPRGLCRGPQVMDGVASAARITSQVST